MRIFSIGFENYDLKSFRSRLLESEISRLVDVRRFPNIGSSGFAMGSKLRRDINPVTYVHADILSPTEDLLKDYFGKKISWEEYEARYLTTLEERRASEVLCPEDLAENSCLMCLEHDPEKCHRRLALEFLQSKWKNLRVIHL